MASRRLIGNLILLAVVLPITQGVLYWVGMLLTAMGDTAGALFVGRLSLVCGVGWIVGLIVLLILVALSTVGPVLSGDSVHSGGEEPPDRAESDDRAVH